MEFLNKHYEKLILLGMLLFFILAMVNVISIANDVRNVKDTDLEVKVSRKKYAPDVDKKELQGSFALKNIWDNGTFNWKPAVSREKLKGSLFHSDMTHLPGLAVCLIGKDQNGKNSGCGMLVPLVYFNGHDCPNCGRKLPAPPIRPKRRRNVITPDDSDGDGMPNAFEATNKLDPFNPYDALYDKDGDGFSNYYEMEQNTDPTNARNHPPLWHRLRLVDVRRVPLALTFQAINTNGFDDPKLWSLQFNETVVDSRGRKREKTHFLSLNRLINIEGRRYRIVNVKRDVRTVVPNKKEQQKTIVIGGTKESKKEEVIDYSKVFLTEELTSQQKKEKMQPDRLEMQIQRTAYSSDRRPILEDVGTPQSKDRERKKYTLRIGERFSMGDRRIGSAMYIMKSFDEKKMEVLLQNFRNLNRSDNEEQNSEMIVTAAGKIGEENWVIQEINASKAAPKAEQTPSAPSRRGGRNRR